MALLRPRVKGRDVSALPTMYATWLGVCGVVAYLVVFQWSKIHPAVLMPATVLVTLALLMAVRNAVTGILVERQRPVQLATLGRFAAQMAHEIGNPLAALKGAAELLQEENKRGARLEESKEFIELMLGEIQRIEHVMDNYHRLGQVEVAREGTDVNHWVRRVIADEVALGNHGVEVRIECDKALPWIPIDRELLGRALQNLVRNALDAMPEGGTLTVRTRKSERLEVSGFVITVEDTGIGMDASTRDRALDSFYTTKARGSGLGLAFARRVVEAHAGDLTLTSREAVGTIVSVRIPSSGN
jgi:two-component system, NtrC family, sensor histidine kinase HydH